MKLTLDKFNGIAPGIDPRQLAAGMAQTAENVNLDGGTLDAICEPTLVLALPDNTRKSIYKYVDKYYLYCGVCGATATLQGITSVSVPINGTTYNLTSLNFSGNTEAEMAAEIQAKLRTATGSYETVEYDSTNHRLVFSSYAGAIGYLTGTSAGSTYLNGTTGGTATVTAGIPEWLSFTEENISVVKSPTIEDIYKRIYYTGYTGGKLKTRGTFGVRDVGVPVPASAPTVAPLSIPSTGFTAAIDFMVGDGTTLHNSVTCSLTSSIQTETGWSLTFAFPGYTNVFSWEELTSGAEYILPVMRAKVGFYGLSGKLVSNIGTPFAVTSGGLTWATATMTGLTHAITDSGHFHSEPDGSDYDVTYAAGTVTLTLEMDYTATFSKEYYYIYRYVTDLGEQGAGSPVSAKVTGAGGTVTMARSTDSTVAYIRLYRTKSGADTASDNFYFVAQVANPVSGNATYSDVIDDLLLTEGYSTRKAPPDNLQGLVAMPSGFLAAYIGNLVYVSDLFLPHSWTVTPIPTEHDIMGLAVSGNDLVVVTKGYPYLISGTDPTALRSSKLMINQACSSSRGICNVGTAVSYGSPDGEVILEGSQAQVITEKAFQRSDWQGYTPSSMIAGTLNGKLYMFMTGKSLVFSLGDTLKFATSINDTVSGLFCDLEDDILYVIQNGTSTGAIYSLNTSATAKLITYKSKEFQLPKPVSWSAIKVNAASYPTVNPILVRLYANGVLAAEMTMTSTLAKRLPIMRKETLWSIEILSYVEIYDVSIADNIPELGVAK